MYYVVKLTINGQRVDGKTDHINENDQIWKEDSHSIIKNINADW